MVKEITHQPRKLTTAESADLMRRGLTAWVGSGGAVESGGAPVAARVASKAKDHGGKSLLLHHVVVHAGVKVLAVYRVRNDNLGLRRLVRPPKYLVRLKG